MGKTPAISTFTDPLEHLQMAAYEQYETAMEAYRQALEDKEIKNKPSPPNRRFYYVQDFTWESLVIALKARQHFLVSSDELAGFVQGLNQYKSRGGNDRQRWLSAYDGRAIDVLRTGKNFHVPEAKISILGGIQPSVLKTLMDRDRGSIDGFWSRFMFIEIPSRKIPCPIDAPEVDLEPLLTHLYEKLNQQESTVFRLCSEGKALWKRWWDEIESLKDGETSSFIRALYPKLLERAARIAITAHAVNCAFLNQPLGSVIPASTLAGVIAYTKWTLKQTRLVYGDCGYTEHPEAQRIARFVQRFAGKTVTGRRVTEWWTSSKKPSAQEARQWLDNLVKLGYAKVVNGKPDRPDFTVLVLGTSVHPTHPVPEQCTDVPSHVPMTGTPEMPSGSQFQEKCTNVPATGAWIGAAPEFLYNDTVMARRLGLLKIGSKLDQKFRLIAVNRYQSKVITPLGVRPRVQSSSRA